MALQTIYSDDLARIQVDQTRSYIELEWYFHPDSASFRAIISRAHAYSGQNSLTKWLFNLQRAEFLELADQHWLVKEIFADFNPILQHDYAYFIRPMVLEVPATYHIQDVVEIDAQLSNRIRVAVFTDMDLAHSWLFTPSY